MINRFFDDAAVFPPGEAPLERAVSEHYARRGGAYESIMGPLVLPAHSVAEAAALFPGPAASALDVSIVVHADEALPTIIEIVADDRINLRSIELKISPDTDIGVVVGGLTTLTDAQVFVEVDSADVESGILAEIAEIGALAKFRTGGLTEELFPSSEELARFVVRSVAASLPFKLTAGLHQGIRYTDPVSGFTHHGFINIADAVSAARSGSPVEAVADILASVDSAALVESFKDNGTEWRHSFLSFGTCSIAEPLESLAVLGLVPEEVAECYGRDPLLLVPADTAAEVYSTPGYGIENLPYGSYSAGEAGPVLGIRLGSTVFPAAEVAKLAGVDTDIVQLLDGPNLDLLLGADHARWSRLRTALTEFLHSSGSAAAVAVVAQDIDSVTLHLPFTVSDYVDFYASEHHASNVGKIFRPEQAPLLPNWKQLPVGYHGRSSTVIVSGTDVRRPKGLRPEPDGNPTFGPSRKLDIEAELGFVVGDPRPHGEIDLARAENHIFGVVVLNDWSARDIQAFEYIPLGPFLGKSFATSISAWVTPLAAFESSRVPTPHRDEPLADYLDDTRATPGGIDIHVDVLVDDEVVATTPYSAMYYSPAQMLTHLSVNGAAVRAGDLFGSGTISGPKRTERGSFLEMSWGGREPMLLSDGSKMTFLNDGQSIGLQASAQASNGTLISLGDVWATILPATSHTGSVTSNES